MKFTAFLFSYSGAIAILGIIFLSAQVWGYIQIPDSTTIKYTLFDKCFSPIAMSVVASVIFYFLSFYFPNVRRNKIEAKEITKFFRRLKDLNDYSLMSLYMYPNRMWKNGVFRRPSLPEIEKVAKGKTLQDMPYLDCWKDDEIYSKVSQSVDWISFFTVIVEEQDKILDKIAAKVSLHPSVKEQILKLKGWLTLDSFLKNTKQLGQIEVSDDYRQERNKLIYLILFFFTQIETIAEIENTYNKSIYRPL